MRGIARGSPCVRRAPAPTYDVPSRPEEAARGWPRGANKGSAWLAWPVHAEGGAAAIAACCPRGGAAGARTQRREILGGAHQLRRRFGDRHARIATTRRGGGVAEHGVGERCASMPEAEI